MIDVVVDGLTMVYDCMEDWKIVVIDLQSIQNWCSRISLLSSLEKNDLLDDLYMMVNYLIVLHDGMKSWKQVKLNRNSFMMVDRIVWGVRTIDVNGWLVD